MLINNQHVYKYSNRQHNVMELKLRKGNVKTILTICKDTYKGMNSFLTSSSQEIILRWTYLIIGNEEPPNIVNMYTAEFEISMEVLCHNFY